MGPRASYAPTQASRRWRTQPGEGKIRAEQAVPGLNASCLIRIIIAIMIMHDPDPHDSEESSDWTCRNTHEVTVAHDCTRKAPNLLAELS